MSDESNTYTLIEAQPIHNENVETAQRLQQVETVQTSWDSLFVLDLESCFLSYYIPCHVVGKVSKRIGIGYPSLFILYGLFYSMLNYSFYLYSFSNHAICSNQHYTEWCFLIYDKYDCKQTYTTINNENKMCEFNEDYNTCYASNTSCITKNDYDAIMTTCYIIQALSGTTLFVTHLFLRRKLKHAQKINQSSVCNDVLVTLCCHCCSFAQQYRSIDRENIMV